MEYQNGQGTFLDAMGEMWYDVDKEIDDDDRQTDRHAHRQNWYIIKYTNILSDWASEYSKNLVRNRSFLVVIKDNTIMVELELFGLCF